MNLYIWPLLIFCFSVTAAFAAVLDPVGPGATRAPSGVPMNSIPLGFSSGSPTLTDTRAYLAMACHTPYAADRATGTSVWGGVSCGGGGATAPVAQGRLLAVDWGVP